MHVNILRSNMVSENKIKLPNHLYNVIFHNKVTITGTLGNCDPDNTTIYVETGYPVSKQEESLAHESLHALLSESGANVLLKDQEEPFVTILESTFYYFLKHNTDFFERYYTK